MLLGLHSVMDEASAQYIAVSQHPGVIAHGEPRAGAHTDMFVHTQAPPVHACCGFDAARHEAPDSQQSGFAVVHDAPVAVHWSSSHWLDVALHVSPAQHAVAVQSAARPPHCGAGGAHTPSAQTSPGALQQSESSAQAWPDCEHVGPETGALHAPLVAPGAMSHARPVQQSASTVQAASAGWHASAHWQTP